MSAGWIKVYRSIKDWEWFRYPGMLDFWVRLLLKAEWEGDERGSIVTSISDLAKEVNCSVKQVRLLINHLVESGEVRISRARSREESRARMGTKCRTRITICKYDSYQGCGQDIGQNIRQEVGQEVGRPPVSPSSSSPVPLTPSPPLSPSVFEEEKEKKKEEDISFQKEKTDYQFVQKLWNDSAKWSIPKVRALSSARKEKVRLRIKEMGGMESAKETLAECFKKIGDSDFCNGATGKWVATFDWFFENEKNWLKVLEGNYDNRQAKSRVEQLAELSQKGHEFYSGQRYGYGGTSPYGNPQGGGDDGPDEQ